MFRLSAAGVLGAASSGWLGTLAAHAAESETKRRHKNCILLFMTGGPRIPLSP